MNNFITIVSGLPRSGTSMMMKMLETGGMDVVVDNIREADEDNLKGYYEFEGVKGIKEDTSWLGSAEGKAVKMVSMLLYDIPQDRRYKIIFIKRNLEEILSSQRIMLERRGEAGDLKDEEMKKIFTIHLEEIKRWLDENKNMEVLYINYNEVIEDPYKYAEIINAFLGNKLDVEKMAGVVDKSLYRQRIDNKETELSSKGQDEIDTKLKKEEIERIKSHLMDLGYL